MNKCLIPREARIKWLKLGYHVDLSIHNSNRKFCFSTLLQKKRKFSISSHDVYVCDRLQLIFVYGYFLFVMKQNKSKSRWSNYHAIYSW